MSASKLWVDKHFVRGEISPLLYGSFAEHMGRVVYGGIYEPSHQTADENGFRQDVLQLVRDMGVTCVRYPGGNFVSGYDWLDGVGPKEDRPRRRELAWRSTETNAFGTDEFMQWAKTAGVSPIFAVNLGTKGVENALSLLEYCNLPTGTKYSNLREKNGHEKPYGVPIWCLGNEMDGVWQIGHKSAQEYASLAAQTAYAMKVADPGIKTVVCGSSSAEMETYTDWERTVLERTYEHIDYLSLHHYYGGQEMGTAEFLAQSVQMEHYIQTVIGICDTVQAKKRGKKRIDICFDEWGVWEIPGDDVAKEVDKQDWPIAPAISEQIYTMEDALLFSGMLMALVRRCDRVKVACQSLLTNISAAIMTKTGGEAWAQTIYYPFAYMSQYGRGQVLLSASNVPAYRVKSGEEIPVIDELAVWNKEQKEVVFFLVNRGDAPEKLSLNLQGFRVSGRGEHVVLNCQDLKQTNLTDHMAVVPKKTDDFRQNGQETEVTLLPYSWNMVRIPTD